MLKKINLEEIFDANFQKSKSNAFTLDLIKKSMKDACQQVLELAAESAFASPVYDRDILTDSCVVDKQSILDVINQVK